MLLCEEDEGVAGRRTPPPQDTHTPILPCNIYWFSPKSIGTRHRCLYPSPVRLFQRTTLHAVIFHHVLCKIALRSCLFANGCECSGLPLTILCVMCAAHNQQPVSIIKCVRSEDATHSGVGTTTLWGKAIQQQQKMWEDKLYTKGYVRRKDDVMLLVLECWSMSVSVPFAIRHIAIVQQY